MEILPTAEMDAWRHLVAELGIPPPPPPRPEPLAQPEAEPILQRDRVDDMMLAWEVGFRAV